VCCSRRGLPSSTSAAALARSSSCSATYALRYARSRLLRGCNSVCACCRYSRFRHYKTSASGLGTTKPVPTDMAAISLGVRLVARLQLGVCACCRYSRFRRWFCQCYAIFLGLGMLGACNSVCAPVAGKLGLVGAVPCFLARLVARLNRERLNRALNAP
jgi:hypothetical protein